MTKTQTHTLAAPGVDLVYDVRGPLPPSGGRPVLFMIGQPMTAEGSDALAAHLTDRTVVTYDPRGRFAERWEGHESPTYKIVSASGGGLYSGFRRTFEDLRSKAQRVK
jgi:hypothetical protein